MTFSIFVDGSGGTNSGFGYFVKETGESFYEKKSDITNNQAEYMAIISVLKKFSGITDEIMIYSDSKNTVSQLNHEYAINSDPLRSLAREAWKLMTSLPNLKIIWIPRNQNLAGKMLGS
jgi:ribonuclease HI